jgi:hypothetical protein
MRIEVRGGLVSIDGYVNAVAVVYGDFTGLTVNICTKKLQFRF